jgi:ribonuclease III
MMMEYSPYNSKNTPLRSEDVESILRSHGVQSYNVKDIRVFQKAMIHSTYVRRSEYTTLTGEPAILAKCPPGVMDLQEESYEQLEFRGDSLLGAVVSNYICERFPDQPPGFLTNTRKLIVRNKTLGTLARDKLHLDKFFVISRHVEEMKHEHGRQNIEKLGDVLEAFIAALWIDSGYNFQVVNDFVVSLIEKHLDIPLLLREDDNYKDRMQKFCQQRLGFTPTYKMLSESLGIFTMAVINQDGTILGQGKSSTKKQAEQFACKDALTKFGVI